MTKGRVITPLTPATCEEIQTRMLEVCRKIAEDHGLVIERAGWRGTGTGFSFEPVFRVSIPASDGTAFNLEKDRFEFLAEQFGLALRTSDASSAPEANGSGSPASIQSGHATRSPQSEFPTAEDSNLPPKTSPCSCKPRRASREVLRLFRKLARIAASGRLGLFRARRSPESAC
ncbi:hypothetical protein [Mesorhizobium sp. M2A.F.Ca.ET.042.01.1.1]|uniref:hypothetical protein n=1 Tax=Mesorhizobium sp. M2A.F.Ca.ET.042.01.1.1 TaxID=2496745 RepID=UPI001FE03FE6|nr:hypothetical protein [Mesorhizobium sp. M2A.F.Ca.ET.042.01.1.1]